MATPPRYMPALITPFDRRGELDLKAHTTNLRALSDLGIEGFVIGGSNGQGPYLEPGERSKLVRAGRRRKTHLMCAISGESTRLALGQVAEAIDAGADTVLVMTPTSVARGNPDAMLRHFTTIADQSKVPIYLYSVPAVTAYSLPLDLVAKLSRHPNIVGMKDSSGDVVRLQAIVEATPGGFIVFSGASRALSAAIAVGSYGAITGSGNYVPQLVLRTLAAALEDPERARRLQKQLNRVTAEVEAHGLPGVHAAARAAGLEAGYPREPLTRLSRGAETSIAKLIT